MESYCIINKQVLHFPKVNHGIGQGVFWRTSANAVKAEFPQNFPFKMSPTSVRLVGQQNVDRTSGDIIVKIVVPEILGNPIVTNSIMALETSTENPVFKTIWTTFPMGRVSLTWHVTDFGEVVDQVGPGAIRPHKTQWKCAGIEINRTNSINLSTNTRSRWFDAYGDMKITSAQMIDGWRNGKTFLGTLSVFLEISESPYGLVAQNDHFAKMRTILNDPTYPDLELVTREKKETVKCHRAILAVNSSQIKKLLEGQPNMLVIEIMRHLSFECINAFLAYVYYKDVAKIFSSAEMAVQVLEPALDYGIKSLSSRIEAYIISKENDELTANQVIRIFVTMKSTKLREFENGAIYFGDIVGEHRDDESDEVLDDEDSECEDSEVDDSDDETKETILGQVLGEVRSRDSDGIEQRQSKRVCTDERAGFSGRSPKMDGKRPSGINENGTIQSIDNSSGTSRGIESYTMRSDMNGGDGNHLEGLERRVVQLIGWHLVNNNNALMESVEFKKLTKNPEVLMQVCNIFGRVTRPK